MTLQVRLHPAQLEDLARIRDIPADTLVSLVRRFEQLAPVPLDVASLRRVVSENLCDLDSVHIEALVRQCLQLHGLVRQRLVQIQDVSKAILASIEVSDSPWTKDEQARWVVNVASLESLVTSRPVRMVAAALDLSFDYANLLQSARIITDIRPIFDAGASAIEGSVVSYTLRLKYDSLDGDHGLSIALDEKDIRRLHEQCERAIKKANLAREWMSNPQPYGVPTLISGEQS